MFWVFELLLENQTQQKTVKMKREDRSKNPEDLTQFNGKEQIKKDKKYD